MKLKTEQLTEIFKEVIQDRQAQQAIDIVRRNSEGKIWIIGRFVYKSLATKLYGKPAAQSKDYDFIVEQPNSQIVLPDGWTRTLNHFGNPKFVGDFQIDFVPLKMVYSILKRKFPPSIENYLNGTPLNIQSIAYDIAEEKVIGDVGISALERRVVAVNNSDMAKDIAWVFCRGVDEMIKEKAEELDFKAMLV